MHLATSRPIKATPTRGIPRAKGRAAETVSFLQVELQPSPLKVLPSSHSSPKLRMLSPHSSLQLLQPSPVTLLPSSHCSAPLLLVIASPQYSTWQLAEQPSPSTRFPSPQVVALAVTIFTVQLVPFVPFWRSLVVRAGTVFLMDSMASLINFLTVIYFMVIVSASNS